MSERSAYASRAGSDLDREIRRFIAEVAAGFATFPPLDTLSFPEARRVAEQVRAPWARGGPTMLRTCEHVLPGTAGDLRLRRYDPSAGGPKPALVYLHGGGWTLFSIDTHDRLMREYAARAQIVVVGIDYPLAPEVKFPVALERIEDAVRWIQERAPELGIDRERLALGGDSAGANLTLATCLRLRDAGSAGQVSGMLLNYGAYDSRCSARARAQYGGAGYMLGADEMDSFWRNYLRDDADYRDPLACPALADLRGLPPAFLVIPECDLLTEQNLVMAERLRAAQVPTDVRIYAGASHSFLEAVSIAAISERALDDSAAWLRRTFAQTA